MEDIFEVAKFFLKKEAMTHKKLQKMCYYAQAWYLANHNIPLVPNRFEAWVHGPVSPDLYSHYKDWGWLPIAIEKGETFTFSKDTISHFLNLVYSIYGKYTGDELEAMTHQELPWKEARRGYQPSDYCRKPISQNTMMTYYGKRLKKKDEY